MKLSYLFKDIVYEVINGSDDIIVNGICYNSKDSSYDMVFVCINGFSKDGCEYIDEAIDRGCSCIVIDRDIIIDRDVCVIRVNDSRECLAKISRCFYGYPDRELVLVAVTGTKGKTTTCFLIKDVLDYSNMDCGYIGTLGVYYKDNFFHTINTTPESYDVYKYMRDMINSGIKYLVMEVSSQALKLDRFKDIVFDYAIFTNISIDHIGKNEHDSFDDYVYCKSKLFRQCKCGIYNCDDSLCNIMSRDLDYSKYYFGSSDCDLMLVSCNNIWDDSFMGIEFRVNGVIDDVFRLSIPGDYNSYNAMGCILLCYLLGISSESMKNVFSKVSVRGRMEFINISCKFNVIIDYAYQGIAMEKVIKTIREFNPNRIVCIFGCGGNRSKIRRYDCGKVVSKYSDYSIITSDNPRYEDNKDIVNDILSGMLKDNSKYVIIHDRRDAIRYGIVNAMDKDVILILGKGHEDYQEINGIRYPFDERVIIRDIVNSLNDNDKERLGIICERGCY